MCDNPDTRIFQNFAQTLSDTTGTVGHGLGGGFKYGLFSSLFGEMIQFDEHIFQMGWFNHQLAGVVAVAVGAAWMSLPPQ